MKKMVFLSLFLATVAQAGPTGGGGATGGGGGSALPASARGVTSPSLVLDMTLPFSPAINDRYEGGAASMYSVIFSYPDSTDDFVAVTGTIGTLPPCSGTLCVMSLPGGDGAGGGADQQLTLPSDYRYLLCRDSTAGSPGYAPCSGTGGPGTCTSTLGASTRDRVYPITIYHAGLGVYKNYSIINMSSAQCQGSGTFTVNIAPTLLAGTTSNDTIAPMYRDRIHYTPHAARALGRFIADATLESTHIPRTNLIANGTMESDCSSGWTVASGSGTIAQTTTSTAGFQSWDSRNSVWGNGCSFTAASSGATIQSPAITTTAGKIYAARFYLRVSPFGASTTASVAVTNSADLYDFTYDLAASQTPGWKATATACQSIAAFRDGSWSMCIVKWRATSTTSNLVVGGFANGTTMYLDEVYAWQPDLQSTADLQPLFLGRVNATLDGDSQVATYAQGGGGLGEGLDSALAAKALVTNACPMSSCSRGHSGAQVSALVDMTLDADTLSAIGLQRYLTKRPSLGIWQFIVNDFKNGPPWGGTAPATPDTARSTAALVGAMQTVGSYSELPIWLTPQPWGYASGSLNACSGWECGKTSNAIVTGVLHSGQVGW